MAGPSKYADLPECLSELLITLLWRDIVLWGISYGFKFLVPSATAGSWWRPPAGYSLPIAVDILEGVEV
jgi:hypothetical protein